MTDAPDLLSRFNTLSRQPLARQLRLLLGVAASIAIGISLVQWVVKPDFAPLYGELSPSASGDIIRSLETGGIQYRVNNTSGIISVPADKVREMRLKLASEGLPQNDAIGFDMLFKEQEMGISSFVQKARFDRALERELAASIASLDSVKVARVHLALPKQSAFVRKKNKPAASVLLGLYAGRELTERQLAGVVHLVAFSVPGLEAEQVSVVDNNGKLLSSQNSSEGISLTGEQFRFTEQLEQRYADRITEILTPILGYGAIRAQVTAEVDFIMTEKTSEVYAPERNIRSEELVEELTAAGAAGGIPGTLANQPPEQAVAGDPAGIGDQPAPPTRSSKREVRNYELGKTISHVRETPGTVKKLSVAVVLDYQESLNDEGVAEQLPLTEVRLAELTALIREAVGFDEARGDKINVVNASFVVLPEMESMPEIPLMEKDWFWRIIKFTLAGGAFLLLIFTVLRPLMQATATSAGSPNLLGAEGGMPGMNAENMAMGEDRVTLGQQNLGLPGAPPVYQQQLSMARSMVEGEPERVAHVVKNWVAVDG
jgi:flagellar M-ring protein FliF